MLSWLLEGVDRHYSTLGVTPPPLPVLDVFYAFTNNHTILNTLSLVWGVRGFYYDRGTTTDQIHQGENRKCVCNCNVGFDPTSQCSGTLETEDIILFAL